MRDAGLPNFLLHLCSTGFLLVPTLEHTRVLTRVMKLSLRLSSIVILLAIDHGGHAKINEESGNFSKD